ncbi:hypothetical protein [Paraburkholderia caffeinilytica]|uniref:hypothetical protein n=1 Tax=Paraburkholderia caffeinilytica TaxID=1761016 RepID=UPI003DA18B2A
MLTIMILRVFSQWLSSPDERLPCDRAGVAPCDVVKSAIGQREVSPRPAMHDAVVNAEADRFRHAARQPLPDRDGISDSPLALNAETLVADLNAQYWQALEDFPGVSLERKWHSVSSDHNEVCSPGSISLDDHALRGCNVLGLFDEAIFHIEKVETAGEILEIFAPERPVHWQPLVWPTVGVVNLVQQGHLTPSVDGPMLVDLPARRR